MTMDVYSLNYLNHLSKDIYSKFTDTKCYPYPNILLDLNKDKKVTQYHFKTKTHSLYTALHSLWYKKDLELNKFIKIVPLNISEMFSEISLAYWIMDDAYFDSSASYFYFLKKKNKKYARKRKNSNSLY